MRKSTTASTTTITTSTPTTTDTTGTIIISPDLCADVGEAVDGALSPRGVEGMRGVVVAGASMRVEAVMPDGSGGDEIGLLEIFVNKLPLY